MFSPTWQFYLDAGGTFTDCLAIAPEGHTHRIKVLSHSALRGTAKRRLTAQRLAIEHQWPTQQDIWTGYQLQRLGKVPWSGRITQTNLLEGWIEVDTPLPAAAQFPFECELSAGEEAPILAARLLTATPLDQPLPPLKMRLGSTRGTNALLERKGARTALLITAGFEDLLLIGNQQRPDLFALHVQRPAPLYQAVFAVPERLQADGSVEQALSESAVQRLVADVQQSGCETVAIALLHAYRNPVHEVQLRQAFHAAGLPSVSCSQALAPVLRLLPRAETTLVNAYLAPVIEGYLQRIQGAMPQGQLQVMTSAGGLQGAAHFLPKDSLLSGPAGGVVGAAAVARACGYPRILTLDMGGTSSDVARYDGEFAYVFETQVGPAHLLSPAVAVETVAAGGGSCCTFDGQKLAVGPDSAGATPGPACYGAGGPLTLTDVNFLLDRLDPNTVSIPLDRAAAAAALQATKGDADLSDDQLLRGFLRIAHEKMAAAIRRISVEQGYDPQDHALLAFGGAGGQHTCAVAALLGITQVLLPREAGILSAVGMQQARLERFATQQVLQPWESAQSAVAGWIDALTQQAQAALAAEGLAPADMALATPLLYLRLAGQDQSLELPYQPDQAIPAQFKRRYQQRYGHWVAGRAIELESIKVMARQQSVSSPSILLPEAESSPSPDRWAGDHAVFDWETLPAGARISGPALIVSSLSTTYLEAGWVARADEELHLHLTLVETDQASAEAPEAEAVQLELFSRRFQALALEMGALLQRSSFSVNVKERLDFSCALLDPKGYLIANAPHIPVHLGSLGVCVRAVCAALDLQPGDVAITNHPGYGGSHLPDVTLIAPVYDAHAHLLGYVANRAHHAEIGGKRPGSMPPDATCLLEEGVVIAPMKLVTGGVVQWADIEALLTQGPYPTRNLAENLADLHAGMASIHAGVTGLQALAHQVGHEKVWHYQEQILAYAAAQLQVQLAHWEPGEYIAEERLDDGSLLRACWALRADSLTIDFSGSAGVHPGNLNANPAIVNSAIVYVLRLLVAAPIPLNEGLMRPVEVILPEGMLHPPFGADPAACPAVVGGNVETSQRLVDTLLKALGLAACSQGTMNNLLFGNDTFGYYETIGGGTGAGPDFAGASGVHQHMTNTRMTDPEVMELRYPVQVRHFGLRQGSGGMGAFAGGEGIIRRLRFLAPVSLTVLTQHRQELPYGLAGGQPGAVGWQVVRRADGTELPLSGIDQAQLTPGDEVEMHTPGGGGFGEPV
jgi:5-oxoprolinase (ATP-hydrolysing)